MTTTIKLNSGEWSYNDSDPLGAPGGFGEVFRGEGPTGPVAIKRLKLSATSAAHRELNMLGGQLLPSLRCLCALRVMLGARPLRTLLHPLTPASGGAKLRFGRGVEVSTNRSLWNPRLAIRFRVGECHAQRERGLRAVRHRC